MSWENSPQHAERPGSVRSGSPSVTPRYPLGPYGWWLHPAILFAVVVLATMTLATWLSPAAYSLYGTPKYLNAASWGIALLAIVGFVAGCLATLHLGSSPSPLSAERATALHPWFRVALALALFGYVAWAANGVRHGLSPDHIRQMLSSNDYDVAEELKNDVFLTISGVTTCTQFGMAAVVLACLVPLKRMDRWGLAALCGLAALRAFLYSERLAGIELIVPAGLVLLRRFVLPRCATPVRRWGLGIVPLVGVAALVTTMGASEYFRSWRAYRNEFDSLGAFTVWRLSGYYATSLNNGAMAWENRGVWPLPYYTLLWFWRFPLLDRSPFSYERLTGVNVAYEHEHTMALYGTLELNNPGGLFCPTLDFGLVGGGMFWLALGLIAGRLYREYRAGALGGFLFYPLVFLAILETPRLLYLSDVRGFPSLAFLLMLAVMPAIASRPAVARAGEGA